MFSKRTWIILLVGINALLLLALIAVTNPTPAALAQVGGRSGDFVGLTAKVGGHTRDVLYVVDIAERKLHALYPKGGRADELHVAATRDLAEDFKED